MGIRLPTTWALLVVISLTAVSNLMLSGWFQRWSRRSEPKPFQWDVVPGLVMIMDMLSLTALLYATGGPNNPFFLFFFVNLCLSAVVLNRRWAWRLNLLTICCFGILLYDHYSLDQLNLGVDLHPVRLRGRPSLTQMGLFAAFATCASVITYFMIRLTSEIRNQQIEVRKAQAQQARSEKLEALGTLAAGAAHELATPLSTIAVVAHDVEQAFNEHPPDFPGADDVIDDVRLIRSQLERCRNILDRMASHTGQAIGESIRLVSIHQLVEAILQDVENRHRIAVDLPPAMEGRNLKIPLVGLSQALRGLVQNALDADEKGRPVNLDTRIAGNELEMCIRDHGLGMSSEVLDRVSEPFFTTKAPGKGMGLGVFLATNVIHRLGGRIRFESEENRGTKVSVWLPLEA